MNEKQTILAVDDRPENLLALETVLADVDADLVQVPSGHDALAATLDHEFALAIVDVQMPGMDGYELAELLRGDPKTSGLPIIFVTAYSAEEHQIFKGYVAGAVDYIVKPYNPDILLSKVRVFLELDRHRRRLEQMVAERTQSLDFARRRAERQAVVLKVVRTINQLIVRETDVQRLIGGAVECLARVGGYQAAWIMLLPEQKGTPVTGAETGFGDVFPELKSRFAADDPPACCRRVLQEKKTMIIRDPLNDCSGDCTAVASATPDPTCKLASSAAYVPLVLRERAYGVMCVAIHPDRRIDSEEQALLGEVAGDLAFALHGIHSTRRRDQYAQIVASSSEAMALIDCQYRCLDVNQSFLYLIGRKEEEVRGCRVQEVLDAGFFEQNVKPQLDRCFNGEDVRVEAMFAFRGDAMRFVDVVYTPCFASDGDVTAAAVCVRDVTQDKLAQKKIKDSERLLRFAIDQMPVPVIVATGPDVSITRYNQLAVDMLVQPTEDLRDIQLEDHRKYWPTFHPDGSPYEIDDLPLTRAIKEKITTRNREIIVHHETGDRWISASAAPLVDSQGSVIAGIVVFPEITEFKQIEAQRRQALEDAEALLAATRAVLEQKEFASVARTIFDICAKCIDAMAGYFALLAQDGQNNEVIFIESGDTPCTVDPSLPMPIRGLREEAYKTGQVVVENAFAATDHVRYLPDGHAPLDSVMFAPLMLDGSAVGLLGYANKPGGFSDHDAKMAEAFAEIAAIAYRGHRTRKALKSNEERLQAIFEATADYIMLLDREHRIQVINRTEQGMRLQDVINVPLFKLVDEMDQSRVKDHLDRVVDHMEKQQYDTTYVKPDNSKIYFSSIASPVIVSGRTTGSVVVSRDVTERRQMHAQLAQSDRLSSMGMLAAGVAHEINNPLSYVLYNLESLNDDMPRLFQAIRDDQKRVTDALSPQQVEETTGAFTQETNPTALEDMAGRFKDALEGTRRIRRIVRGLGTFSRVEEDQLVPVDLTRVIEAAINMSQNEIKYRARVARDLCKVPSILASEGRLSQVFLNLLVNAAHAIDEGDAEANEIRVRTWSEDGWVCAEVRDTGCGVNPEHMDKLFEPFFSTKEIGVGSGLGLPISKGIVESYGGDITVDSSQGKGTSFVIRLPVGAPIETPKTKQESPKGNGHILGRVLVIDDETAIRTAIVRILRDHDTEQLASGAEAMEFLKSDQDFDAILCDMMMPEVSGMDLHRWLIQEHPELAEKLIFITGGAFTPKARSYLADVDNLRIEKPFSVANLRRIVNDFIRFTKRR